MNLMVTKILLFSLMFIIFCFASLTKAAEIKNILQKLGSYYDRENAHIDVINKNGNVVSAKIVPVRPEKLITHHYDIRILINEVWNNSKPVSFRVKTKARYPISIIALSGEFYNRTNNDLIGFHVKLSKGVKWAEYTRYYMSGHQQFADIKDGVNNIYGWDERMKSFTIHYEIPYMVTLKDVEQNFAAIGLIPNLPRDGKLVIGTLPFGEECRESLDWLIDTTDVKPGDSIIITFQPTIKGMLPDDSIIHHVDY